MHDDGSDLGGLPSPGSLPVVIALLTERPEEQHEVRAVDVVVGANDVDPLLDSVSHSPIAASALAVLLRGNDGPHQVEQGLAAESAVYSTLQAGPEFAAWRQRTPAKPLDRSAEPDGPTVAVERLDDVLAVTLDRPSRHNAISARLRDDLHAALAVAIADSSIRTVELRGNGPSFCSGGDLDEFGRRPDPATAHVTRLLRSPARSIHRLAERTTAFVHGATFGGGIEMAAFARHVVAHPDTRVALPEIRLGLVPGAGGTVSLPLRIGRHRTAWLALTGAEINAPTAADWGLIDELDEVTTDRAESP